MARLINALEQLFSSEGISTGPSLLISYSSASGSFSVGETVTGGTSGATVVVKSSISPQITGSEVTGTFQVGETITGGTSGATATVDNFFLYDFPSGAAPLENGLIDFFESGSSTVRKTTYSDAGETIANANPVVIGGDGRVPDVYGTGNYRMVVRTSTGVQILARDPVGGDVGVSFGDDWIDSETYAESDVVRDDTRYWQSLNSGNIGNRPSTDGGVNWLELPFDDIATNTSNIATNTANIATNTSDIGTLNTLVPDVAAYGVKATDTGIADAYIANTTRDAVTLSAGLFFSMFPLNANTGASTVDISDILGESAGTTVKNIKKISGGSKVDPASGDIITASPMDLYYDGTDFLLLNVQQVPVFTESFTSAQQTITSGGTLSLAHGLSTTPKLITAEIVCATSQAGYSVNDSIPFPFYYDEGGTIRGFAVTYNSVNINLTYTSAGTVLTTVDKATGARTALTNGNWRVVIKAYA